MSAEDARHSIYGRPEGVFKTHHEEDWRDQRVGLFPVGIHSPYRGAAETTGAIHNRAAIRTYRRSREEAKLGIGRDLPWFPAGLSQPELARSAGERRIEHAAVLRPLGRASCRERG